MSTKRNWAGSMVSERIDIVNNTGVDLRPFDAEIMASLRATGTMPEELADLFTVTRGPDNADGSPRWILNPA